MNKYHTESAGESNIFCPELGSKFLAVITEDAKPIVEKHPYLTLLRVIEFVGVEQVANLNLMVNNDLPFISKKRYSSGVSNFNDYKRINDDWFVFTALNLKGKVAIIEKIGSLTGHKFTCATKRII